MSPTPTAGASALTLAAATRGALERNPTARAAAQELAQAQARLGQAVAGRRLQITLSSSGSVSNADVIQPPPKHETFGSLLNTLSIPIPIGERSRLAIRRARQETLAAEARYQAARVTLANQVAAAYYDLLRKQVLLTIAEENLATARRQLADAEHRFAAGDVPELDVLRARVPVASAEASLYGARSAVAVARQALNGVTGESLEAPVAVEDVPPVAPALPYTLEEARRRALSFAPELRAAEATIRADEASLAASRRYREPTLSVQASDLRSSDQTAFSREDSIQATVTVPLADGGLGRAQVREAEAALEGARQLAAGTRRTVLQTVTAAFLTAESSRSQVAAAQVARDVAQTAYEKTVLGYQNGLYPLTDVLSAQAALVQARTAYTQAVYDAAAAVSTLRYSLGEGLQ